MRKKGFTLIELLAVIVILAIIALIATPIILGIINDAREESNERSVELYASAVKNAIANQYLNGTNKSLTGTYDKDNKLPFEVDYEGDVECTTIEIYEDGNIYVEGCTVNNGKKEYVYGEKQDTVKVCELSDEDSNGKYSVGDIVTCKFEESTEQFYVIENEDEDTTKGIDMLAKYNLNVGHEAYPDGRIGIQNELAKGDVSNVDTSYGSLTFSTSGYWVDENYELLSQYGSSYPAYVYNKNTDEVYPYVSAYEDYLKENGVNSAKATLISYEQLEYLGCSGSNLTCDNAPSWVYSTRYWTGSASRSDEIWFVIGGFDHDVYWYTGIGVRPVITISTSEI